VNTAEQTVVVPTGTYLGQAGPGVFISVVANPLTEVQKPFAWRWTRITSHKRDSADAANGYVILVKDITDAADGADVRPKLLTIDEIEKEAGTNISLYGHSITRGGDPQGHDHSISNANRLRPQCESRSGHLFLQIAGVVAPGAGGLDGYHNENDWNCQACFRGYSRVALRGCRLIELRSSRQAGECSQPKLHALLHMHEDRASGEGVDCFELSRGWL